jgi:lysophospholipase L1-like esterase
MINRGANLAAVDPRRTDDSPPVIDRRLHPDVFYADPTNVAGLLGILRLANERNVPVFWLLPPISPQLQARRDQSGAEAQFERFIQALAARYPRLVTVLDARRGGYPASLFTDHTHLNGQGAIALSRAVAQAIKPVLANRLTDRVPAWMALARPAGHFTLPGAPLEDLEQSRAFLGMSKAAFVSSR